MPNFDLSDPRTFAIRLGGLPDLKFVYTARVNLVSVLGVNIQKHVTIRSLNLLSEAQILDEAIAIVSSGAGRFSNSTGTVESAEVTGATRPSALGV